MTSLAGTFALYGFASSNALSVSESSVINTFARLNGFSVTYSHIDARYAVDYARRIVNSFNKSYVVHVSFYENRLCNPMNVVYPHISKRIDAFENLELTGYVSSLKEYFMLLALRPGKFMMHAHAVPEPMPLKPVTNAECALIGLDLAVSS